MVLKAVMGGRFQCEPHGVWLLQYSKCRQPAQIRARKEASTASCLSFAPWSEFLELALLLFYSPPLGRKGLWEISAQDPQISNNICDFFIRKFQIKDIEIPSESVKLCTHVRNCQLFSRVEEAIAFSIFTRNV